jgi:hypothetical protein
MRRARSALPLVLIATLSFASSWGCGEDEPAPAPAPPGVGAPPVEPAAPKMAFISPLQHLVRASMALRGIRPSVQEMREVAQDPSRLGAIVDQYLATPEFGAMIRELHDEALRVKIAPVLYPAGFPARGPLAAEESQALNESVTDAPLRLIEHVVTSDKPYSEIVTADYTMADRRVAEVWGLAYDGDGREWRKTHFADGREHAGILSDSFLFTRHSTTYSNANRGRANAVSSALLCYDFLQRDITIDATINLADPEEVANATKKNEACASCHQTLDPLAAYFAGFRPQYVPSFEQSYPIVFNVAPLAKIFSRAEPAYFGRQGSGLAFVGSMIAQDPRFSLCAAKRFYSYLNQVPLERVPIDRAAELQSSFVKSNMNARALVRAIVLSDDFRASHPLVAPADGTPEAVLPGVRKVRARELGRLIADLTRFRWETQIGSLDEGSPYDPGPVGRIDLMTDSFFGYAVLFGGTDSYYVTRTSHSMNATAAAVLRGVASKAAAYVVTADGKESVPERRALLRRVTTETDEASVRAQIADLHARIFGELVEPSSAEVTATYALFEDARKGAGGDVERAWSLTIYAMLQDMRLVFY